MMSIERHNLLITLREWDKGGGGVVLEQGIVAKRLTTQSTFS